MEDRILLRVALGAAIAGLLGLWFWQHSIELDEVKIPELGDYLGKDVRIIGTVKSAKDYGKLVELKVEQPATISVILFKDKDFSIPINSKVEIKGEVQQYKGKLEIVASEIKQR